MRLRSGSSLLAWACWLSAALLRLTCVVIGTYARLVFKAEQYRTVGLCQALLTYSAPGVLLQCFAVTSSPVLLITLPSPSPDAGDSPGWAPERGSAGTVSTCALNVTR